MLIAMRTTAALMGLLVVGMVGSAACPCCTPGAAGRPACCAAGPATLAVPLAKAADEDDAKIQANLAKLSDDDRKLAAAQKWCAVETDHPLGSMGAPIKVMVKDQPVFVCCKGCVRRAQADPDKTLAVVNELKAKAATDK